MIFGPVDPDPFHHFRRIPDHHGGVESVVFTHPFVVLVAPRHIGPRIADIFVETPGIAIGVGQVRVAIAQVVEEFANLTFIDVQRLGGSVKILAGVLHLWPQFGAKGMQNRIAGVELR